MAFFRSGRRGVGEPDFHRVCNIIVEVSFLIFGAFALFLIWASMTNWGLKTKQEGRHSDHKSQRLRSLTSSLNRSEDLQYSAQSHPSSLLRLSSFEEYRLTLQCTNWRTSMLKLMALGTVGRAMCFLFLIIVGQERVITDSNHFKADFTGLIENDIQFWLRESLFIIPSILYAASFATAVRFWELIERTHHMRNRGSINCLYHIIVSWGNLSFFVVLGMCAVFRAFFVFHVITISALALIFLALAVGSFYYGMRMVKSMADQQGNDERTLSTVKRLLVLSLACPVLWVSRSLLDILLLYSGFCQRRDILNLENEVVFRSFVYLATELVPTIIMLMVFWPHTPNAHVENRNTFSGLTCYESSV